MTSNPTPDPTAYVEVLARLLCAADVHVHGDDHPTWKQLVGEPGGRIRDDYRKAARWLAARLTVQPAVPSVSAVDQTTRDRIAEAPGDAAQLAKVVRWVTSEVVSAMTEFGDGYRAAQRDIRDLIRGRFDDDAANGLRRLADEAQQPAVGARQPDTETPTPSPASPAPTALRARVLREILARIDGTRSDGDSATEEVGAATVRAVLAEILADMQPDAGTPGCPDPIECSHEAALGEARETNRRLNREKQRLESELAAYRRAVGQWEVSERGTYIPHASLRTIGLASGKDILGSVRHLKHFERVEQAEAAVERVRSIAERAQSNVQRPAARLARRILAELPGAEPCPSRCPCHTAAVVPAAGAGQDETQEEAETRPVGCCGRPAGAICVHDLTPPGMGQS